MSRIRVVHTPAAPAVAERTVRPLSHHEVLALAGPFSRRGRHVDLTASRRAERQIAFRSIEHAPPSQGLPPLREDLILEVPEAGNYRLVRTLSAPRGELAPLKASLTAEGPALEVLIEQVERLPFARQVQLCAGVPFTQSYRLYPPKTADGPSEGWQALLTEAQAEVEGVTLTLAVDPDRPALLRLTPPPGQRLQAPEDLLAVLGWDWRPLQDFTSHWRGSIRLRERGPGRTPEAEAKLARTIAHLARTLAGPPAAFHPRHRRARWRVAFQRSLPVLGALGLIAATPAVGLLPMEEGTLLRMLIFHAPPLLLIGFFLFGELPRFEVPSPPRALKPGGWLVSKGPK